MKIFIKGFKSIKNGQYVAIGKKITFLVGPNSAGKSVVMHALEKLNGESPAFAMDENMIYRNPNNNSEVSGVHSLGVEWDHGKDTLGYFSTYYSDTVASKLDLAEYSKLHHSNIDVTENDYRNEETHKVISKFKNRELLIAIDGLGEIEEGEIRPPKRLSFIGLIYDPFDNKNTINLSALDESTATRIRVCAEWLLLIYQSLLQEHITSKENGDSKILTSLKDSYFSAKLWLDENLVFWDPGTIKFHLSNLLSGINRQRALNTFEKHNALISKFRVSTKKDYYFSYPGKHFDISLVSADRMLPTESDLVAHITSATPDNIYHELIKSHIEKEWWEFSTLFNGHLADAVNKALSENLFTDNGYQIQVASKILTSKTNWDADSGDESWIGKDNLEFTGTLSLKDSHGRHLDFKDVGSGIGYVLPILIESFRESNRGKLVFLQQPELHLHPALQACLTDVLIEASTNKKIVAETHSEHMILRALKRVRQTSNGSLKDPELKLDSIDVAVNYFEPLPDGTTRIHILRLSQDGDFLDRWPNGFFAERDQEFSDE